MDKKQREAQVWANLDAGNASRIPAYASSYEKVMAQRNLRLLGRCIDLNLLITQRIHKDLVQVEKRSVAYTDPGCEFLI